MTADCTDYSENSTIEMSAENIESIIQNDSSDIDTNNNNNNHSDLNEQINNVNHSSVFESQSSKINEENSMTTINSPNYVRYNCTPVERNETAQLIVVNSSSIPSYLQLKNYFIVDFFYMNHSSNENNYPEEKTSTIDNETATTSNMTTSSNETGQCAIMIFYYNWCRFSAAAAPQFNALGRLYPQMYVMAIDAYYHYSITIRFGVSGVPSMYFLYNGRAVAKYNRTDITMDGLVEFIRSLTSLEPIKPNVTDHHEVEEINNDEENVNNGNKTFSYDRIFWNITDNDRNGPLVIHLENQQNYLLIFCWKFCLIVLFYHFFRSNLFAMIKDHVRGMWNEWAQTVQHHEHAD